MFVCITHPTTCIVFFSLIHTHTHTHTHTYTRTCWLFLPLRAFLLPSDLDLRSLGAVEVAAAALWEAANGGLSSCMGWGSVAAVAVSPCM
jgi:hypothetical protein